MSGLLTTPHTGNYSTELDAVTGRVKHFTLPPPPSTKYMPFGTKYSLNCIEKSSTKTVK